MIKNLIYKVYCLTHKVAKIMLRRVSLNKQFSMIDVPIEIFEETSELSLLEYSPSENNKIINVVKLRSEVYPTENIVPFGTNTHLPLSFVRKHTENTKLGITPSKAESLWREFIEYSVIPYGYKNGGLHYAGYISKCENGWCLPSWIWTNAAIIRVFCKINEIDRAIELSELLEKQQLESGGWIVRDDYSNSGPIPVIAPNDSAYIANNAFLRLFELTKDKKYLNIAVRCADWIISVARSDGLVPTGFNASTGECLSKFTIVDIGFTADFFANLYACTNEDRYKKFLNKFIAKFIELFYLEKQEGFATSIDDSNKPVGGLFARGQAWALEGMIAAYSVSPSANLKTTIEKTISTILKYQLSDGGWPYNFSKPLLGEDCKGVPVIAKSLMNWCKVEPNDALVNASAKALKWCEGRTETIGAARGGIFSFNMEGAIVHNLYSSTAFVYSSSYALELKMELENHATHGID